MYNKPITQRVAFARSKKPSALKQTDTTVLKTEKIPVVKDEVEVDLPDTTETITKAGKVIKPTSNRCGTQAEKDAGIVEQTCEESGFSSLSAEEVKKREIEQGLREPDTEETIVKPGGKGKAEAPQYMYDTGDAMPAWMQRSVERGLTQSARKTGKFASKLAKDQKKLAKLEKSGKTDSPKYAKLKARVGAREGAFTAQKLFAETQMEAARQGKSPGSKNIVNIGTFDPNVRVTEVDDATRRTTVGRKKTLADVSTSQQEMENQKKLNKEAENQATINATKNQENAQKRQDQEDVAAGAKMKVGPLKMKSSFKMSGYGSKTYKK